MDTSLILREATLEDSDGLQRCMKSAYSMYQNRMGGERLPPMDVDYSHEIENYPTWIVESQGIIVGGMTMVFEDGRASIANIAVNPNNQGQGIGGQLIRLAESKAKECGYAELRLTTHIFLHENISLYQHLGWEEMGREESKVFMKKEI